MGRRSRYSEGTRIVKSAPPPALGTSDRLLVKLGPRGQGKILLLTDGRPPAEVTRRLRALCRVIIGRRSWRLGETR